MDIILRLTIVAAPLTLLLVANPTVLLVLRHALLADCLRGWISRPSVGAKFASWRQPTNAVLRRPV
ncbi:MAG: hypothetical protein HRU33_19340 [Rhodobacteraceae bacterium]|nr:hypothetical protein [Paracoccaceae bacterium]